ncbi:condensation domain-containing protein [Fulvivirga maritima]|uniref:condensation domain-containing protein n=1 Tax=Fulvivirga maritima TaxID=2904247 RepID=UPI001F20C30B|nr:condensation domain-containing protein [Fulvivirga maritima]UII24738.1 condensation domain-containing protein [Fulvivirga maritima]
MDEINIRKLSVGERLMYLDGKKPFNIYFGIRIAGTIELRQLEHALQVVQTKHPLLRSVIRQDKNGSPCYHVLKKYKSIPIRIVPWKNEQSWWDQIDYEWSTPFDLERGASIRLLWVKGKEKSDLLIISPHAICDGASFVVIIKELLSLIDNPDTKLENYSLCGDLAGMIPEKHLLKGNKAFYAKLGLKLGGNILKVANMLTKKKQFAMQAIKWTLPETQTKALIAACKENNTTVHAALCVAFMRGFHQVINKKKKKELKVISPIDIRKFLPDLKPDMLFSFAPAVRIAINGDRNLDFWSTTRKVLDDLKINTTEEKIYKMLSKDEIIHPLVPAISRFMQNTKGSHCLTLSNLGKIPIPLEYKNFKAERMLGTIVGLPWYNANTVIVNTLNGIMSFAFMANHYTLTCQQMREIASLSMNELQMACRWKPYDALSQALTLEKKETRTIDLYTSHNKKVKKYAIY